MMRKYLLLLVLLFCGCGSSTERVVSGYRPFELSAEQRRHFERQRFEVIAHLVKRHSGDKRPVKEIAADLALAEMKTE